MDPASRLGIRVAARPDAPGGDRRSKRLRCGQSQLTPRGSGHALQARVVQQGDAARSRAFRAARRAGSGRSRQRRAQRCAREPHPPARCRHSRARTDARPGYCRAGSRRPAQRHFVATTLQALRRRSASPSRACRSKRSIGNLPMSVNPSGVSQSGIVPVCPPSSARVRAAVQRGPRMPTFDEGGLPAEQRHTAST